MSKYTVNSLRFQLRARAAEVARDLLLAHPDISSLSLGALTTVPVRTPEHRFERLSAMNGARQIVSRVSGGELGRAVALRRSAEEARRAGNQDRAERQFLAADRQLVGAINATVRALRVDERQLALRLTRQALTDCGFQVRASSGTRSNGIWAERGDHVIAALVQDGGVMEIDHAGAGGGGCAAVMHEVEQALGALGVDAEVVRRVDHGDDRGGQLIRRACRIDPARPEVGLVRQFEGIVAATPRESISATRVSRRVVGGQG